MKGNEMPATMADRTKCFCVRWVFCLFFWSIVSGLSLADFAVGLISAGAAAWASVHLFPCWPGRSRLIGWIGLTLRIPVQALIAGADVARRALDPALPLQPGFVAYSTRLPQGTAQNAFAALAALLPGSVPVRADSGGSFEIHCLDTRLPVAVALAAEEARLRGALGLDELHG
jgi:multicomponent Na+:H+ antiporter subunit E